MSKITKTPVAQGLDPLGRWVDLGTSWGIAAKKRYRALCNVMNGHGWQGARIIERIVIEHPTGQQKICKLKRLDRKPDQGGEVER